MDFYIYHIDGIGDQHFAECFVYATVCILARIESWKHIIETRLYEHYDIDSQNSIYVDMLDVKCIDY